MLDETLADSSMEIRRIKNRRLIDRVISTIAENETLDDLNVNDVFERCLDAFDVPDEDRDELIVSYNEIIKSLDEEDVNAQ
jgi:exonuclease SbcD